MTHDERVISEFSRQAESLNATAVVGMAETLDALVDLVHADRSQQWLDAACGPGVVARRLAPAVGHVHGIDMTPAMIELAREEAARAGISNARFDLGDATATGHPGESFDGALTRFAIHHIPLPGRLLEELARVVRPGGSVIVADHVADEDADAAAWSQEIERLRDPSHWACLPPRRLRALGEAAGLMLEEEWVIPLELDFDDWLRRGSADPAVHRLVERAIRDPPRAAECFYVRERDDGIRVLGIRLWLSRWQR
jgi:SAM-dependent methyltransferase